MAIGVINFPLINNRDIISGKTSAERNVSLANALQRLKEQQQRLDIQDPLIAQLRMISILKGQRNLMFPLLATGGLPGQVGSLEYLDKTNPDYAKILRGLMTKKQQSDAARNMYYLKLGSSIDWRYLPPDEKRAWLSTARGMGYDPSDATKLFEQGVTLSDLANKKGVSLGEVTPNFVPTTTTISSLQRQTMGKAANRVLSKYITEWTAPYARKFAGYSPKAIWEAIKNDDPKKIGKFYAGIILTSELSSGRFRQLQGQVGIEAIKHLTEQSMQNFKPFDPGISPEAYTEAQYSVEKGITDAADAERRVAGNPYAKVALVNLNLPQDVKDMSYSDIEEIAREQGVSLDEVYESIVADYPEYNLNFEDVRNYFENK